MKRTSKVVDENASRSPPLNWAGLTIEEAIEFEMLDRLPPFDDSGKIGWIFEGEPTSAREKRWLQLYSKLTARPANPRPH